MRIRQVKPAFWTDSKLAAMPPDSRLFYIGLWQLADDDGWLRWDVSQIGVELYGYDGRHAREKRIERMAGDIMAMPGDQKLVIHECGHARLPRFAVHQHLAGTTRRITTVRDEHIKCEPRLTEENRDEPRLTAINRPVKVMGSDVLLSDVSGGAGGTTPSKKGTTRESDGDREARITRLLGIVNDTSKSESIRRAAHDELNRLGWVA